MPVIKVNDQQYSLRPGQNRLGAGVDADVLVDEDPGLGIQAIVDLASGEPAVIRCAAMGAAVRVNGIPLVEPTPLLHGDKVEIGGQELLYSDDTKVGATQFVSASEIAALAPKRQGTLRATTATGGRMVSLTDGKEYAIQNAGITIGRDAGCGVVVAENEVSRRHAEVAPIESGYELRDFSANGVFVNGTRVERPHLLSRADVIRVGTEEFRFYADVAPVSPRPAQPAPLAPELGDAPAEPALAVLEFVDEGPLKGERYDICVPLVHIGRGAHNDIVVPDDGISDTHAKLQRRDDGWYLVDVGSTNGTFVTGQRLTGERRLDGVADLRFGGVQMTFRPGVGDAASGSGTKVLPGIARVTSREVAAPGTLQAVATSLAAKPSSQRIPPWIWGVVALAVAGAVAFSLLNR